MRGRPYFLKKSTLDLNGYRICKKYLTVTRTPIPVSGFFPLTTTTPAMVSQQMNPDRSLKTAVARVNGERQATRLKPASPGTSSYAEARGRVEAEMLYDMVKAIGKSIESSVPDKWLWKKKYHVKIIDGSSAKMPDTPENQTEYPQPNTQAMGIGFPITRFAATISLTTGLVLDFANGAWRQRNRGTRTCPTNGGCF